MTKVDKYLDDLSDIKDIMKRSSKFLSLSGLSGIMAGIYALAGAIFAYYTVFSENKYQEYKIIIPTERNVLMIFFIAAAVILLSLITGLILTNLKAKKTGQKIWDPQARRLLTSLMIPLIAGGLICIIMIHKGYISLVPPLTLVFYGLALVNASHHTFQETRWLGIAEVVLGIGAFYHIGYSLVYWAIGFGVLHILYGAVMYFKYER